MQCYTVIVRIGQYGLTPKRYFGIAFIIFEAAYIAYYHLYKKRTGRTAGRNILLIMCVILIISIFAPGISAKGLSTSIAKRTLSSYLKKTAENIQVTGKESMHASAAYDFLSDDEFGSGKIQKYFSGIDEDTLKSLRAGAKAASDEMKDDEERDGTQYGYFSTDLPELTGYDFLDISGYSSMMHVFITDPKKNRYGDDSVCDAKTLVIHPLGNENGTPITLDGKDTIDLSSFVNEFIELSSANNAGISTEDEFRQAVKRMCITDINENARLYITSADITRNGKDEPVYITIEGFLFMK